MAWKKPREMACKGKNLIPEATCDAPNRSVEPLLQDKNRFDAYKGTTNGTNC